ncbi:MAG: RluA family pseudouridine synthase [Bacteroidota bacterium]
MLFPVLHCDPDVVVVDKPTGIATIPERDPAVPIVRHQLEAARGERLLVVHRLDKPVSGVLVFARHAEAHRHLNQQFAERHAQKTYIALVAGRVGPASGRIDAPIRAYGSGRMGVDAAKGKPCHTRFEVATHEDERTRLRLFPKTGRRHQLRVHCYHIGHPILGDRRYGDATAQAAYPRLFLHAHQLTLTLPTGKPTTFTSPVPF